MRSRLVWATLALYIGTDAPYLGLLDQGRIDAETRVLGRAAETRVFGRAAETLRAVSGGRGATAGTPTWCATCGPISSPCADGIDADRAVGGASAPFRSADERDRVLAGYVPAGPPPESKDALLILKRRTETAP